MKTIVKKKAITIFLAAVMTAASIVPAAPVMAKKKYTKAKTTVTVQKKAKTFKKTISLTEKLTIKVKYKKKKVKAAKVSFKSSKKKVATVSKKGVVTPKKVGKTTISIKYGKKKAKLKLMVVKGVSSVKINKDLVDLKLGESRTLSAKVSPANATIKTVKWYSSNPSVVSVTNDGVITGLKDGLAVITAVSDQGNKKDTCNITVSSSYTTGSSYAEPIGGKNKSGNPGTGNSGSTTKPSSGSGSSTGNTGGQSSGSGSSQSGSGQGSSGTGSNTGGSGSGNSGTSNTGSNNNITFVPGDDSTYDALVSPNWIGDPNDPMATLTYRQLVLSSSPYGYDVNTMSPGWHKITLYRASAHRNGSSKVSNNKYFSAKNGETLKGTILTADGIDYIFDTDRSYSVAYGSQLSLKNLVKEAQNKYPALKELIDVGFFAYEIEGGIGSFDLAELREYNSASDFVYNNITDDACGYFLDNLNKTSRSSSYWTKTIIRDLFDMWASEIDEWMQNGTHMIWQYILYGDKSNNPMNFDYHFGEKGITTGPGYHRLGSGYGDQFVTINGEVECWIYVPTKK